MDQSSPRWRRVAGTTTLALGIITLASAAFVRGAGAVENPTVYAGNDTCDSEGFDNGYKIPAQPVNGTYDAGDGVLEPGTVLPAGFEIVISEVVVDSDAKRVDFHWAASHDGGPMYFPVVMVKFGSGGLSWSYPLPGSAEDDAYSTKDSISHLNFCWDDVVTTTTEEDTTTTGYEDTTSSVEDTTTTEEETTTTGYEDTTTTVEDTTTTVEDTTTTVEDTTTTGDDTTTTEEETTTTGYEDTTTTVEDTTTTGDDTTTTPPSVDDTTDETGDPEFDPEVNPRSDPSNEVGDVSFNQGGALPRTGGISLLPLMEIGAALILVGLGVLRTGARASA